MKAFLVKMVDYQLLVQVIYGKTFDGTLSMIGDKFFNFLKGCAVFLLV